MEIKYIVIVLAVLLILPLGILAYGSYTGTGCSYDCINAVRGTGKCNADGSCICLPNWTGDDCLESICPIKCIQSNKNSEGHCDDKGDCVCKPGYYTDKSDAWPCQRIVCPSPCTKTSANPQSNNTCDPDGTCLCDNGYRSNLEIQKSGKACTLAPCPEKCSSSPGFLRCDDDGNCICKEGWGGKYCNCPPQCMDSQGFSSCGDDGTCICKDGYKTSDLAQNGMQCNVKECPQSCTSPKPGENSLGECDVLGNCLCKPGWRTMNTAPQQGLCTDNSCKCPSGYIPKTSGQCGSADTSPTPRVCDCIPGTLAACTSSKCAKCPDGSTPVNTASSDCKRDSDCGCEFTGGDDGICATSTKTCLPDNCIHGSCEDDASAPGGKKCVCEPGYFSIQDTQPNYVGNFCDQVVCDCPSSPAPNNGKCLPSGDCDCNDAFADVLWNAGSCTLKPCTKPVASIAPKYSTINCSNNQNIQTNIDCSKLSKDNCIPPCTFAGGVCKSVCDGISDKGDCTTNSSCSWIPSTNSCVLKTQDYYKSGTFCIIEADDSKKQIAQLKQNLSTGQKDSPDFLNSLCAGLPKDKCTTINKNVCIWDDKLKCMNQEYCQYSEQIYNLSRDCQKNNDIDFKDTKFGIRPSPVPVNILPELSSDDTTEMIKMIKTPSGAKKLAAIFYTQSTDVFTKKVNDMVKNIKTDQSLTPEKKKVLADNINNMINIYGNFLQLDSTQVSYCYDGEWVNNISKCPPNCSSLSDEGSCGKNDSCSWVKTGDTGVCALKKCSEVTSATTCNELINTCTWNPSPSPGKCNDTTKPKPTISNCST